MAFERMLDKARQPSPPEIMATIGQPLGGCWKALDRFLRETYQIEPELRFDGLKHGWGLHYRKGGRPLCDINPENGAFMTLVVLGAKEAGEAMAQLDSFGPLVRSRLENAHAFHDGRWLFMRVQEPRDVEDIQRLIQMKRPPRVKKIAAG